MGTTAQKSGMGDKCIRVIVAASRTWARRRNAASRRTQEKSSLSVGREPPHSRATAYSTVTTAFTTFSTVLVS
jgi:hypothetical protein